MKLKVLVNAGQNYTVRGYALIRYDAVAHPEVGEVVILEILDRMFRVDGESKMYIRALCQRNDREVEATGHLARDIVYFDCGAEYEITPIFLCVDDVEVPDEAEAQK